MSFLSDLSIAIVSAVIGGGIGSKITLYLTDRKERQTSKVRFENRLKSLAHELKINFRYVGNHQNPFQTKALENLVYREPLIHEHPQLFEKAQKCLNTALLLSSSAQPQRSPGHGQSLMKELSQFLSDHYQLTVPDYE